MEPAAPRVIRPVLQFPVIQNPLPVRKIGAGSHAFMIAYQRSYEHISDIPGVVYPAA